jgi:hypothetical protein
VRRVTTLLTAGGMALVVYRVRHRADDERGHPRTLVATGQPDNVMVLRKGAGAEINSGIERGQAAILSSLPGIATDARGPALLSAEPVVLINLPKRSNGKPSNVTVRGTSDIGLQLRPQVRIVEGRMFRPGTSEIVVGRSTATALPASTWAPACALPSATGWWSACSTRPQRLRFRDLGRRRADGRPSAAGVLHRRLPPGRCAACSTATSSSTAPPASPAAWSSNTCCSATPQAAACAGPWAGAMPTSWPPCATKLGAPPTPRWW